MTSATRLLLLVLLTSSSCEKHEPLFCDEDHPCEDPARPFCDVSGEYPASDGVGNTCIPSPFDAGILDAGLFDGAVGPDAQKLVDAEIPTDAAPVPPVVSGQQANLVLGQPDFSSNTQNQGGLSARSLKYPRSLSSDDDRLWASDSGNARVVQFNAFPVLDYAAADLAIGQEGLGSSDTGPTRTLLSGIFGPFDAPGVAVGGDRVVASDPLANRVLVWNQIPTGSGPQASHVLGQTSFTDNTLRETSSTSMKDPAGAWTDGTRVAVADTGFNRVLLWDSWPTANGQAADLVLGQSDFSGRGSGTPPTASNMALPTDVFFDGERLFVVDSAHHRVMVWNGWPTQNNQPADYVVGQLNRETGNANAGGAGPNDLGFERPVSAAAGSGALFVVDQLNNRVLVYAPIPGDSGVRADAVIGQSDFQSNASGVGPSSLDQPSGVVVADGALWLTDWANHRILRFDFSTP